MSLEVPGSRAGEYHEALSLSSASTSSYVSGSCRALVESPSLTDEFLHMLRFDLPLRCPSLLTHFFNPPSPSIRPVVRVIVNMSISSFYDDDAAASRPKTADGGAQRPAMLKRPSLGPRNVSFTPGVQPYPPAERPSMGSRNVSFTPGVQPFPLAQRPDPHRYNSEFGTPEPQQTSWRSEAQMQRIDRHAQNVDP